MLIPHTIAVSEGIYELLKEELIDDVYVYKKTGLDVSDDIVYQVSEYTAYQDGKATLKVKNNPTANIYEIEGLDKFDGVLNGFDDVVIDSIEQIDDNNFTVNVSKVNDSLLGEIEKIKTFGLKLSKSVFYDASFFAFPQSYGGSRISYKTFGVNVKLLITTKDDITNYTIEYLTQKIYDLFYYYNHGSTELNIDGNPLYIRPYGNFSSIDVVQESDNISSRLVTISFSYKLRYKN
ncbi:MAG: hypothetical protein ACRDD8_05325 [Bacteroidales bacterium]